MTQGLAYIAEPIDFGNAPAEMVDYAINHLTASHWSVFRPKTAFRVSGVPDAFVNRINDHAISESHAMVAFLPEYADSVGVPAEIAQARHNGIPVLLVTDRTTSWVIAGWNTDPMLKVAEFTYPQIEAGIRWLNAEASAAAASQTTGRKSLIFAQLDLPGAQLPTRGHDDDAGYDLYTSEDTIIKPGEFVDVPTGVAVDLPDGVWGLITGRSSTLRKRGLLVTNGVIDTGYTGPLFAGCQNLTSEPVKVAAGERICQLILMPALGPEYTARFGAIRQKVRGTNGFGSTGR